MDHSVPLAARPRVLRGASALRRILFCSLVIASLHGCGLLNSLAKREADLSPEPRMPAAIEPEARAMQAAPPIPLAADPPERAKAPVPPRPARATVRQPRARGGKYFQDDGPGDRPVEDLLSLPDATPREEALHPVANNPYVVFGRSYVPERERRSLVQQGSASWYGRKFHGRKTSTGETYDMYALTAAHPTLPLPSYARVTNLANQRSIVVRVNDRGPFLGGRIIDLSYAAAAKLGFARSGRARVRVEAILSGDSMQARSGAANLVAKQRSRADGADASAPATRAGHGSNQRAAGPAANRPETAVASSTVAAVTMP